MPTTTKLNCVSSCVYPINYVEKWQSKNVSRRGMVKQ